MLSFRHIYTCESCRLLLILIAMMVGVSEIKGQTSNIYATYVGTPPANSGGTIGSGGTAGTLGTPGVVGSYSVTNEITINDFNYSNFSTLSAVSGQGGGLLGTTGGISTAYINLNFSGVITPKAGTSIIIKLTATTLSRVQVQAYNSGSPIGTAQAFSTLALRATDEYVFIAPGDCNSIRITTNTDVGPLLGGTSTNSTNVYYAYVLDPNCSPVNYTDTRKTTLLDLGSNITNAPNAIDGNPTTFSLLSNGLGVGTTLYQTVYFSQLSNAGDAATLTLSIPPAALSAGVLGYINLNTYNGSTLVNNISFSGLLLGTDLLTLLNSGAPTTISIVSPQPFDRIEIAMSSLISLATSLNLYEVQVTPPKPIFSSASLQNITSCSGVIVTLTPVLPSAGNELRWYSSLTATTPIAVGNNFTPTPALTANTTYYVATAKTGCTAESERVPVTVTVNTINAGTIATNQTICHGDVPSTLTSSGGSGSGVINYQWQKSVDNITFNNIPGATSSTYTEIVALDQTTYYRRIDTSTLNTVACTASTNHITVTINPKPLSPHVTIITNSQY